MTREEAKKNLIAVGIENPTDEAITQYLDQVNGATKKERDKADALKAKADKADELQSKIDELETQNLSDIEKANKERDDAIEREQKAQRTIKEMETRTKLAEKGITGEYADKLVENFNGGALDVETLAQIISDRETAAVAKAKQDALEGTPNPTGGKGKGGEGESQGAAYAKKYTQKYVIEN